ncbi:MAG: hypothetical protein JWQ98_2675 [Chlorobi bacterium]|nr:hypothetical protein [Chlorobiota bacterium]
MSDDNSTEPEKAAPNPMPWWGAYLGTVLLGCGALFIGFLTLVGGGLAGEGGGKGSSVTYVFGILIACAFIYCCVMTARSRTWNGCLLYVAIALGVGLLLFGMCIGVSEYISR